MTADIRRLNRHQQQPQSLFAEDFDEAGRFGQISLAQFQGLFVDFGVDRLRTKDESVDGDVKLVRAMLENLARTLLRLARDGFTAATF